MADGTGWFGHTWPVTEPDAGELPDAERAPTPEPRSIEPSHRRLRVLPALAIASMLVAGGLLIAVGGMARVVGPAPPTPVPTIVVTPGPSITPLPTKLPVTPTLGPSPSPFGRRVPSASRV